MKENKPTGRNSICAGALAFIVSLMSQWSCPATASAAAAINVRASEIGAHLDTSLMKGGGTDDTAGLPRVLCQGAKGRAANIIIHGAALGRGLVFYANTQKMGTRAGGAVFQNNSR